MISKKPNDWTENQQQRAAILFKQYLILQTAYHQTLAFRNIYENTKKEVVKIAFEQWVEKVQTNTL